MSTDGKKSIWQMEYNGAAWNFECVQNAYKKLDENRKNLILVSTGLGLASAFLPWKTLGLLSVTALQIQHGWLCIVPFVASAVYVGLSWPTVKPTKMWVGIAAFCMLLSLFNSYSEFTIELPNENLTMEKHNAVGVGYWLCCASLIGLTVSSFIKPEKEEKTQEPADKI
jgi:hypothetical protein